MVVALTVTPALALILLRNAPLERHQSPLVRWLKRGYTWLLRRVDPAPAPRYAGFARRSPSPGWSSSPQLGQSLFPHVQGARLPDALGHRARAPRTRRWSA